MDTGTIGGFIASLVAAAVAFLGGMATWKKAKAESAATSSKAVEDTLVRLQAQNDKLSARVDALEAREKALVDYVFTLQLHIQNKLPPPPPAWPADFLPGR